MVEIVTQIKTAESQAEDIRRAARNQAKQLSDETIANAKTAAEAEGQKAIGQAANIVTNAEKEAADLVAASLAQSKEACDQLLAGATSKMDKAATFIVERIVQGL